ncbi:hypothetical protein PIB30_075003 [Stylosanthes scabra]|uniref:Ubiquitin-like protease family profile domain-containing protein n=1 Tax=Stylosanthes scabra TaxID=79078 RepID=A0ABU6WQM3_9FABA|nr:hypothetical protein [Stylosanthes scabra]
MKTRFSNSESNAKPLTRWKNIIKMPLPNKIWKKEKAVSSGEPDRDYSRILVKLVRSADPVRFSELWFFQTRMFDTYGTNYLDKKTKLPYLVSQLKDQEYMELLDREKLKTHSALFASVLYSNHWWLYVLDVDNNEFYIVDSV